MRWEVNFFGSNSSIDPTTETKTLQAGAARLQATSAMYQAESQYQLAAAQDVQGNTFTESTREADDYCPLCIDSGGNAMENFEQSVESARSARARWKQAEYRQSDLIAHLRSQPDDSALRPEVRDQFERLDQIDMVMDQASDSPHGGRLWDQMDIDSGADVVEFCADLLGIDTNRDIGNRMRDRESASDDIMALLEMDHHEMGRMKNSADKLCQRLEEHRDEFENSKHYESRQASSHIDSVRHPIGVEFRQAGDHLTRYSAFFDVMSTSINSAVESAEGDIPEDHLNSYLDR